MSAISLSRSPLSLASISCALALSAALLVSADPASSVATPAGEPRWGPTRTLTPRGNVDSGSLELAVGPSGLTAAVWLRDGKVYAAVRRISGGWEQPVRVGEWTGQYSIGEPQVAVDGEDRVTVLWTGGRDFGERLLTRSRPAGGAWGPTVQLNRLPREPYDEVRPVELSANASGATVAAWGWDRDDWSGKQHAFAAYRPLGGRWGAPFVVKNAYPWTVTVNERGGATYYLSTGPGYGLKVAHRAAAGRWQRPRALTRAFPAEFAARAKPRGGQVIAYSLDSGAILVQSKPAGGRWSAVTRLGNSTYLDLAVDGRGRATVAMATSEYGPVTVADGNRRGGWSRPRLLFTRHHRVWDVSLAANRSGDRVAAWVSEPDGAGGPALWACYRKARGRWGAPVRLTGPATHGLTDLVSAVRPGGQAVVAWTSSRGDEPTELRRVRMRQTE